MSKNVYNNKVSIIKIRSTLVTRPDYERQTF